MKFKQKEHIQLLKETLEKGDSIAAFCKNAKINRTTFYNWKNRHKPFKETYDIYINAAEVVWEGLPRKLMEEGKIAFNFQYWHLIMRNRFKYSALSIPKGKNQTAYQKFQLAWKALENGSLTSQEYSQINAGIANELKAVEINNLQNEVAEIKEILKKTTPNAPPCSINQNS